MTGGIDSYTSIPAAFYAIAERDPERLLYKQALLNPDGDMSSPRAKLSRTYRECRDRVNKIAHYLRSAGVTKGDKVAIISSSRPEWMEADIAALSVGAVVVSVYQSLPWDDIGYILFDSGAKVVFAENQEQLDKIDYLTKNPCPIPATEERQEATASLHFSKVIAFETVNANDLVVQLDDIVAGEKAAPSNTIESLTRDDMAAFVYTSGTTGPPKGVMQTHGNHLANVRQAIESGLITGESSIMLFLPLAHSFAKLMGYLGFLYETSLCFPAIADTKSSRIVPESVTKDIGEAASSCIPLVPRLLEKMQSGIQHKSEAGGIGGTLLSSTLSSAKTVYEAKLKGDSPSIGASILYALTTPLRKKIKKKLFGENFEYCVSGGAKLNTGVAYFFDALGIEILEGYGLTETCVATNINLRGHKKIGTVGPLLADDIELKLLDDGEILFKGPNVALGYHNREAATKSSWDKEGWFHTGDLGAVDDDGYLSIVGRKKEILVTSYGKNIAPDPIEGLLKTSQLISQVVMVGDARPFCVALVTLDAVAVKAAFPEVSSPEADSGVYGTVWKHIEKVNEELARHETIKKIAILPGDFTVDNGFLTPTFKVKRNAVVKEYADQIDALYAE